MNRTIRCESCGNELLLPEGSPGMIRCPKCLAVLTNPLAPAAVDARAPRPVVPINEQVEGDHRTARMLLLVLAAVFAAAIISLLVSSPGRSRAPIGAVIAMAGAVGAILLFFLPMTKNVRRGGKGTAQAMGSETMSPATPPPLPPRASDTEVLAYRARQDDAAGVRAGPFVGGFFGALGASAVAFFSLAGSLGAPPVLKMLVLVVVAAGLFGICVAARRLGRERPWSGVGRGVAVGLTLGMMAVGPCAGCYIIFLFE